MSEPHLYSVDPDGVATEVPPPPPPADTTGKPKAKAKARPKYPVPTDRQKFDTAVRALCAVCIHGRDGTVVSAEDMATLLGIAATTATLNNAWFVDLGLMEKVGKSGYKPTDMALEFQGKHSFNDPTAPAVLRPAFENTWFFNVIKNQVMLSPDKTVARSAVVQALAVKAGTDDSYRLQYEHLLTWLEYVGLIATDDGSVRLVVEPSIEDREAEAARQAEEAAAKAEAARKDAEAAKVTPQGTVTTTEVGGPTADKGVPMVSFSLTLNVYPEDMAALAPDQIAALFDGLGKIAAIKAALAEA